MRIGRINLKRLSMALAPHPSRLPRERELVTNHRPLVCGGQAVLDQINTNLLS